MRHNILTRAKYKKWLLSLVVGNLVLVNHPWQDGEVKGGRNDFGLVRSIDMERGKIHVVYGQDSMKTEPTLNHNVFRIDNGYRDAFANLQPANYDPNKEATNADTD